MTNYIFKGKRKDNGEWVYWNQFGETAEPYLDDFGMCSHITEEYIIPETVGQCTGLEDKNGVKIFEGDIVLCHHEKFIDSHPMHPEFKRYTRKYIVEWGTQQSRGGYRLRNKSIHFALTGNVVINHDIEVIGNVHDKEGE